MERGSPLDGGADAAAVGVLVAVGAGPVADLGELVLSAPRLVGRPGPERRPPGGAAVTRWLTH